MIDSVELFCAYNTGIHLATGSLRKILPRPETKHCYEL